MFFNRLVETEDRKTEKKKKGMLKCNPYILLSYHYLVILVINILHLFKVRIPVMINALVKPSTVRQILKCT